MRLTLLKDQVTETYFMSAVIFVQNWKYIIIIKTIEVLFTSKIN